MSLSLSNSVGLNQANLKPDVALVQQLLNQHVDVTMQTLEEDGVFGSATLAAIVSFQAAALGMHVPDGILTPNGPTFAQLASASLPTAGISPLFQPQQPMPLSALADGDFAAAATRLSCESAAIRAVADVETGTQGAFDSQGRPTILFERHIFSHLTRGVYDARYPDISNPVPGGYGTFSSQYSRLQRAAALNLNAALEAASWGAFQIMGMNCACTGCNGVDVFVTNMRVGVGAHLDAFVSFILADHTLSSAIQNKDWADFARCYNGKDYASHHYDTRLAAAYSLHASA